MSEGGKANSKRKKKRLFQTPKMLGIIVLRYPVHELIIKTQMLVYNWKQFFFLMKVLSKLYFRSSKSGKEPTIH
jgi:hypothetical protein